MRIYLIGYMGSGKSTIGRLLANKLKLDFIDFDNYIEDETKKSITQIFDTDGEVKFRKMEHQLLKKFLKEDNLIISLGGGTPCFHNNIEIINNSGISIYLKADVKTLCNRLSIEKDNRPLIRDLSRIDLKKFIEKNLKERSEIYEKAHFLILTSLLSTNEIVAEITRRVIGKEKIN
jgi:shikimate kinase